MKRRSALSALSAASILAATGVPLRAQSGPVRIMFGYTAVTDFASVFVAREEGYFGRRGLEVELKLLAVNSTIPAALQSDSLTIGGPTSTVFLQAVDGGLDLVVVAGGSLTSSALAVSALVARTGVSLKTAQDCIGRTIGVPGLGGYLHVTFRAWLKHEGVDWRKVNFVEAAFPQHADLLRGRSMDAIVTAEPFISRITDAGVGYVVSYFTKSLPDGNPIIIHAARREWVRNNPQAALAFRESLVEAASFMQQPANDARLRTIIGKYIKLPPDVLAKTQISPPGPIVTEKQLAYWVGVMKEQEMLKSPQDVARLLAA